LRLFTIGGYGLAHAALALMVFGVLMTAMTHFYINGVHLKIDTAYRGLEQFWLV